MKFQSELNLVRIIKIPLENEMIFKKPRNFWKRVIIKIYVYICIKYTKSYSVSVLLVP